MGFFSPLFAFSDQFQKELAKVFINNSMTYKFFKVIVDFGGCVITTSYSYVETLNYNLPTILILNGQTNLGSKWDSIDRYWYGTVAQDIKKNSVVFYQIKFRFRQVQQNKKLFYSRRTRCGANNFDRCTFVISAQFSWSFPSMTLLSPLTDKVLSVARRLLCWCLVTKVCPYLGK